MSRSFRPSSPCYLGLPAASESQAAQGNRLYGKEKYVESWSSTPGPPRNGPRTRGPSSTGQRALPALRARRAAQAYASLTEEGLPAARCERAATTTPAIRAYQAGTTRPRPGPTAPPSSSTSDKDARHNLAMALRSQKNPPKQCPNPKKDQTRRTRTRKTTGQAQARSGQAPETQTRPRDQMQGGRGAHHERGGREERSRPSRR